MSEPAPTANKHNSVIWPELWSAFAPHRTKICRTLRSLSRGPESRLCIWGSGRPTDLDLIELVKHFCQIDLVDLHPTLTEEALVQRGFDEHPKLNVISGMDVTGVRDQWTQFKDSPTEFTLQAIIDSCLNATLGLAQYDVVASTCLLSQILLNAHECIQSSGLPPSAAQEYFPKVLGTIREKHLELLLDHTVSGGSSVLITDLTSAEALPGMLTPNANLKRLVSNDVVKGNHFYGLNPLKILESTQHPRIAPKIAQVQASAPWIWNAIESRYLCLAFRLGKK